MARPAVRLRHGELRLVAQEDLVLPYGEWIIYEYEEGLGCAKVTLIPSAVLIERGDSKVIKYIRIATPADRERLVNKETEEKKARNLFRDKIRQHGLPMHVVDAVYTFDFSKITFYFTAPSRVDFRALLRDLTSTFRHTRIVLRQIGVRDETKLLGGMGPCGQTYCCSTWLKDLAPINMKMATDQGLAPNASKLTGGCGRLFCCLKYELPTYAELQQLLPPVGSHVRAAGSDGIITDHLIIKQHVMVQFEDGHRQAYPAAEVSLLA